MTDVLRIAGTDLDASTLPAYDRELLRPTSMAFDGQIGSGSVFIRDGGTLATDSGRRITLSLGSDVLADGFLGGQQRSRPADDVLKRGNVYTWQDTNILLSHIRIEYWDRPAETDITRVLAAMAAFCPAVDTSHYVSSAIVIGLPAKIYQDSNLDEIFADAMDQTAKTWFVDRDWSLHFHGLDEDVGFNAPISITDSSPNGVTSFAPGAPTREADPYQLSNDLKVVGSAGNSVIVQDAPSMTQHDADGLVHQDTVNYPDSDDTATLEAYGVAVLASRAQDRVTYHCNLSYIPDPTVLQAGMRIEVTSAVFGVTAQWMRIAQLGWETNAPGVWMGTLEMAQPVRSPWELRGRRRRKKPPTSPPDAGSGAWSGGALSLVRKRSAHEVCKFDSANDIDTYTYDIPAGGPLPGSYIQHWVSPTNPNSPCTGFAEFYWTGRIDEEAWYEVDLSSGIDDSWLGLLFTSETGAGPVDESFGAGHSCHAADDHPYEAGWGYPDPTATGQYAEIGGIDPFNGWKVFIPRHLLVAAKNAFVIAPNWQCYGSYCGLSIADGTRGPLIGGEGGARRYEASSDGSIACVPVVLTGVGKTQWVPGDGPIDGSNATFRLIAWNGSGTPEARVDGAVMVVTDYTWDASSLTVTFPIPPQPGAIVAFRYNIG